MNGEGVSIPYLLATVHPWLLSDLVMGSRVKVELCGEVSPLHLPESGQGQGSLSGGLNPLWLVRTGVIREWKDCTAM